MPHAAPCRLVFALLAAIASVVPAASPCRGAEPDALERGFARPPDSARPWVYWFWLDGNITREGITADLEAMKRAGIGGAQIFRNRLRLREGPGAMDAEHLGGLTSGIHATLLNGAPETPEGEPVIRILEAWPKDWDAAFRLLGRGGFLVSVSHHRGAIEFVEVVSQAAD